MRSFWALSTERQIGMAVGPIPWSKRREFAVRAGLDDSMIDAFVDVIAIMDASWLKWTAEEAEKGSNSEIPKKGRKVKEKGG